MGTTTIQHKLDNFLFGYRNTPLTTTQCSPAQLVFKQIPRTKLNMIKPKYLENNNNNKERKSEKQDIVKRVPMSFFY